MSDGVTVRVRKWSDFSGRTDIKHHTWFRMDNRILENEDFDDLSDGEILAWVYILSLCSQKKSDTVYVNFERAERFARRKQKDILSAIAKLEGKQLDRITPEVPERDPVVIRTDPVRNPCTTLQDSTVQTEQDSTWEPAPPDGLVSAKPPTPMGVYVSAYQAKYGHRPEVGPREGKILKTFSENHPQRWRELIEGYLQMPDSWAVQRSHPVEVLVAKVNEIGRFLATGKVVTRKVVQAAEEMIDQAQGTHRKPRKSIEELERERAAMLAEASNVKAIGDAK